MEFLPDDHPSEVALKKSIIRIYNEKLTERDRRKKFVIMHGHIDFKKLQAADKRRSKGERELVGRLRMFARFQTPAEHEALVEGLIRAQRLKEQINNLKLFRKMGIKTLEQARQYEIDRKKRENDNKNKNKLDPNLSNSKLSSMAYNRRSRGDVDDAAADITGGGSNKQKGGSGSSVLYSSVGKGGARVDISAAPSAGLLSREELELCAELPLLPAHYIAAKDTIIREAFRSGSVTKEGVMRVIKLEPNSTKADQIYDFFARGKHLPSLPPSFPPSLLLPTLRVICTYIVRAVGVRRGSRIASQEAEDVIRLRRELRLARLVAGRNESGLGSLTLAYI